jgi:acetyl-CoA/propionyl-CoA carboxylase carboxyl transferase subunit
MTTTGMPPVTSRETLVSRRREAEADRPTGGRTYTARQRAEQLVDDGTFRSLSPMRRGRDSDPVRAAKLRDGDGVVVGWGTIQGRKVMVVSHDFSVSGGSIGGVFAERVMDGQRLAIDYRMPIVYINDSGGARIHEGIDSLHGCGGIFALNVKASKVVPQVSLILGPCAGAAAYSPALTDWTIMVRGRGQMFLTGPEIVKAATGEIVDPEDIGGSDLHTRRSGVAHLEAVSEDEALDLAREILVLTSGVPAGPGRVDPLAAARLPDVVPPVASRPFDMNDVLDGILDDVPRLEVMPERGTSIITAFARFGGRPVGVVANQPRRIGGILESISSTKAARFVNYCGRFGLPILTFVDVPGFLPGSVEERNGVITHGASLLRAYVEAESPKLTVVVRKAYGGAYIAMGSASLGADATWAWDGAEIAVMGPGGAVGLLHRRELAASDDPAQLRQQLAEEYRVQVTRPQVAAEAGVIDEVILPEETRDRIGAALDLVAPDGQGTARMQDERKL